MEGWRVESGEQRFSPQLLPSVQPPVPDTSLMACVSLRCFHFTHREESSRGMLGGLGQVSRALALPTVVRVVRLNLTV